MSDIVLQNLAELQQRLAQLPDALQSQLLDGSQTLAQSLAQNVRDDKLSGQVLAIKSGFLRDSIESTSEPSDTGTTASMFVAGDVSYAAIQEYGGVTKAHVIEAGQGKKLAFNWAGKQSFFRSVHHPGSDIPAHDYLGSALFDMQDEIITGFKQALLQSLTQMGIT